MARLGGEPMASRFIRRFASDGSYDALTAALRAGQGQEAFRAAHTLKGVAANLGLERLCAAASALVYALAEVLRETGRLAEAVMEPGRAEVTGRGECCREFAMVRCGLEMLARQYPESVELGRDLPREGGSEWTSGR